MAASEAKAVTGKCRFGRAWAPDCGKPCDGTYCAEHARKRCVSCGAQATHECAHTGQFVCGAYLCDGCAGDEAREFPHQHYHRPKARGAAANGAKATVTVEGLARMGLRELDRLVAEKVFGVKPRDVRIKGDTATITVYVSNPALSDGQWTARELGTYGAPPLYSSEAAHDYRVLEHVRSRWGHTWQGLFQRALYDRLCTHEGAGEREDQWHSTRCGPAWQYRPGDYALAALAVVLGAAGDGRGEHGEA